MLLVGALGAAAVVARRHDLACRPALVAADPSGAATPAAADRRPGSTPRAERPRRGRATRVRGRRDAASRPRSDPTPPSTARLACDERAPVDGSLLAARRIPHPSTARTPHGPLRLPAHRRPPRRRPRPAHGPRRPARTARRRRRARRRPSCSSRCSCAPRSSPSASRRRRPSAPAHDSPRGSPSSADATRTTPSGSSARLMGLYSAEGTSPMAGCLPLLIQAPIVGVIYALFILPTIAGHPNALLEQQLAGVPLGSSLAGSIASGTLDPGVARRVRDRHRVDRAGRRADAPRVPSAAGRRRGIRPRDGTRRRARLRRACCARSGSCSSSRP